MSGAEVRRSLDELAEQGALAEHDGPARNDLVTRLAWRPAWSIRSRRGALRPFLDLIRGKR